MNTSDFSIHAVGADQLAMPGTIRLPLVSFVITGRRGSDFSAAIEALRIQDYPRFEVIVVNADATDAGRATLFANDPRFKRVDAPADLCPFRLATLGLAAAEGEFIAFLETTDLPSPGFAAAHIQAHLASRHNVAFTASRLEYADLVHTSESASGSIDAIGSWLQPNAAILRLCSLDEERFADLASRTALVEPTVMGWTASPAALQLYRRFIIDLLHPPDATAALPASAAAHYAPLCQLLGGSVAIGMPLSKALRAPGTATTASCVSAWSLAGDRHKLGVWAANGAEFSRRIGPKRYWDAFASMLGIQGEAAAPNAAGVADLMAGIFWPLAAAFGEQQAIQHLHTLLPRRALLAILKKHYGRHMPLRVHWAIQSAGLRQFHEGVRLHLRARRSRRRQARR